ncbi:MAG: TIGR00266 family protein [Acidimicrobiaceae bacterium]|nr:TIGR00266 family protein [Acidimicrobiaceae bacterium]
MRCHEVDYVIMGDDLQYVKVELDPGEKVIAEAGAMMFMEEDISFEAKMGDGTDLSSKITTAFKSMAKRFLARESIFMTHFTNQSTSLKRKVVFAAPYPGKIIPVDLGEIGGRVIAQKDAFLCAAFGTKLDIAFRRKLSTGLFGGEGFIMQNISGDGLVFLQVGGAVYERRLNGEKLLVDTGCLVALEPQVDYSIERAGDLKSMLLGGEGLFLATLQGHGRVWLQSLPFNRLAAQVLSTAPRSQGEGSVLGRGATIFERT